ncbi:fumarylacetoacetate hydrolase family protein [Balneatrix alpica]|uniref:fumarylacetoacetate hydrolase family protein n=1 Tax=Balneatrix alpica TaxID=75684 RepID=UPI0027386C16|nr:fumarylacetoacetate hydrolase family protein [Balneatrix alpica]
MSHAHRYVDGETLLHPLGKVVCIGRNYAEHAKELNNPIPTEPILFIKPSTSVTPLQEPLSLPQGLGEVHHELELAVLIGTPLRQADEATAKQAIAGYGLALDLTLRELQSKLKEKGQPWEKAKCFDGACPLSPWLRAEAVTDVQNLNLSLTINGEVRQQGNTADMLTPVYALLAYASRFFTLEPGDVVLTGTPAGVGPLRSGDQLSLSLDSLLHITSQVK